MSLSLYFYCWLRRRQGHSFRQAFATWKRFHMYRAAYRGTNGFTHPDLYRSAQ